MTREELIKLVRALCVADTGWSSSPFEHNVYAESRDIIRAYSTEVYRQEQIKQLKQKIQELENETKTVKSH